MARRKRTVQQKVLLYAKHSMNKNVDLSPYTHEDVECGYKQRHLTIFTRSIYCTECARKLVLTKTNKHTICWDIL
jgi:hypothetical protein